MVESASSSRAPAGASELQATSAALNYGEAVREAGRLNLLCAVGSGKPGAPRERMRCANCPSLFELAVGLGDDPPAAGLDVVPDVFEELPQAAAAVAASTSVAMSASVRRAAGAQRVHLSASASRLGVFGCECAKAWGDRQCSVGRLDELVDSELSRRGRSGIAFREGSRPRDADSRALIAWKR